MISGQWEISFRAVKDNDSLPNYRPLVRWHMAPPHWQSLASPFQFNWVAVPVPAFFPQHDPAQWFASTDFLAFTTTNIINLLVSSISTSTSFVTLQANINIFIYVHLIHRPFCCFSFTLFSPQIKTGRGTRASQALFVLDTSSSEKYLVFQ